MRTFVYVTDSFAALHCWPDAPENMKFLRHLHRHLFQVKIEVEVTDPDRQVEFLELKNRLNTILNDLQQVLCYDDNTLSCEQMCAYIFRRFNEDWKLQLHSVEVSEDGENGAKMVN